MFEYAGKTRCRGENEPSFDADAEKIELLNLRAGLRRAIFKRLDEETGISPELLELTRILVSTYPRDKDIPPRRD